MTGKPGAPVCKKCHGKGHGKIQCSSKGGGKWVDPSPSPGKGYGAGKGNFGKGTGKQGKGNGGYGKGKSKFNNFDGGFAPPGFE